MFATIRRYDGVDQSRTTELTSKVNKSLVPKLRELPGFAGYYLIEAEDGIFSSLGLFETAEQGKDSSTLVASWIREEKLETLIPNTPKITSARSSLTATVSPSLDRRQLTTCRLQLADRTHDGTSTSAA